MEQVPEALHEAFLKLFSDNLECDVELADDGYLISSSVGPQDLELEFQGIRYNLYMVYNCRANGLDDIKLYQLTEEGDAYDILELSDEQIGDFDELVEEIVEATEKYERDTMYCYDEERYSPYTAYRY